MTEFGMKDSGERQEFSTGAQRDTQKDKPRPDLISPFALWRMGVVLGLGAVKYKERNWELGMGFTRVFASHDRHATQYKMGERDEDHLAQAAVNLTMLMHYEELIKRGRLPKALMDLPDYDYHLKPFNEKLQREIDRQMQLDHDPFGGGT